MIVIGIVGGVASGKSLVADLFQRLGAAVVNADQIGHEVLCQPEVEQVLSQRWGPGVFGPDGRIDRGAVAGVVFAPEPEGRRELAFLEALIHPRIAAAITERVDELARRGTVPAVVLDAPVMLEAGWNRVCDKIVFVDADRKERLERALRRGWTPADLASREAAQLSLQEKEEVADGVIDNSRSIDHTFAQVQQFWRSLGLSPA